MNRVSGPSSSEPSPRGQARRSPSTSSSTCSAPGAPVAVNTICATASVCGVAAGGEDGVAHVDAGRAVGQDAGVAAARCPRGWRSAGPCGLLGRGQAVEQGLDHGMPVGSTCRGTGSSVPGCPGGPLRK